MKNPSFLGLLWESFKRVYGTITTPITLFLALLSYLYPPTDTVSGIWVIVLAIITLMIILIFTLWDASRTAYLKAFDILPKVLMGKKPPSSENTVKALLVLEPSILFSFEALVSIYFVENNFEELLGIGWVYNVQADGNIQVLAQNLNESLGPVWQGIINNNADILKKLRVKPNIPKRLLEGR